MDWTLSIKSGVRTDEPWYILLDVQLVGRSIHLRPHVCGFPVSPLPGGPARKRHTADVFFITSWPPLLRASRTPLCNSDSDLQKAPIAFTPGIPQGRLCGLVVNHELFKRTATWTAWYWGPRRGWNCSGECS